MTFTRLQDRTPADLAAIDAAEARRHEREHRWCLCLLSALKGIRDEFPVDQLSHCLQVATRADRAGADRELVLIGLLHDVGKPLSLVNHPAVAAAMLGEYLSPDGRAVLAWHGEFLSDLIHGTTGSARFAGEPWYAASVAFAGWDAESFDPAYPSDPLNRFLPDLRRLYRLG